MGRGNRLEIVSKGVEDSAREIILSITIRQLTDSRIAEFFRGAGDLHLPLTGADIDKLARNLATFFVRQLRMDRVTYWDELKPKGVYPNTSVHPLNILMLVHAQSLVAQFEHSSELAALG